MFGLNSSVLLFSTCLMICAVVYYVNIKITALEKALVRQNHVVADFISSIKGNMLQYEPCPTSETGATKEALFAAREMYKENKINVSENSDTDTESDSDESTMNIHTESDNDDCAIQFTELSIADLSIKDKIKTIKLSEINSEDQLDKITSMEDFCSTTNDYKKLKTEQLDTEDEDEDDEDCNTVDIHSGTVDYKKMKVEQLKEIAIEKGISIKGKKKAELLEALN
jgi:hypothetical protein